LMGVLAPDEAEAAVNVASTTSGVQSVVKVFSYITITRG
jgi:osmotically-inducible protein OsmY